MLQIVEMGTQEAEDFLSKLMARGQLTDDGILKTVRRTLEYSCASSGVLR